MAEKYLKLIQNGNVTYVPDNQRNRSFWSKQNSLVVRSRSAHSETVTILQATDEEVAFMQHSDVSPAIKLASPILNDNSAILEMMNRLQRQNEEQAEKIAKLQAAQIAPEPIKQTPAVTESENKTSGEGEGIGEGGKERLKPGPKPKDK